MGSSLVILNGDFKENAIYAWMRILLKKGTSFTLPIKSADQSTTLFTLHADATGATEDTYFEFEVPAQYAATILYGFGLFGPSYNPDTANIKKILFDTTYLSTSSYLFLQNNGLEKITLFNRLPGELSYSSAFQGLQNLKYLDLSGLTTAVTGILYPLMCPNLEEANLAVKGLSSIPFTSIDYLFNNAPKLKIADLTGWRLASGCTYSNAFVNCSSLQKIYIDDADTASSLISIMASATGANIDGSATIYDATNKVINIVHTS